MGGSNETRINGLRLHISEGNIHIHDDSKSLKFIEKIEDFKKDMKEALDSLEEESKTDGVFKIEGGSGTLFVLKENDTYDMFVAGKTSIKSQIQTFLKGC